MFYWNLLSNIRLLPVPAISTVRAEPGLHIKVIIGCEVRFPSRTFNDPSSFPRCLQTILTRKLVFSAYASMSRPSPHNAAPGGGQQTQSASHC